jgi:Arc/MetJ family transcription regulator
MHTLLLFYAYTREVYMRTTLDLPESLLNEAMLLTHTSTKTAVIVKALEDLVRKNKISELKKYKGKIDLEIDLNNIRDRHL